MRTLDGQFNTQMSPYLTVKIIESFRLNEVFDIDNIQPYIKVSQSSSEAITRIATEVTKSHHKWDETLEIDISSPESTYLVLYDNDEYGENISIASYKFDCEMLEKWTEHTDVWLRMKPPRESVSTDLSPEDLATTVTDDLLGEKTDHCPILHFQVLYVGEECLNKITVGVGAHKSILTQGQSFTIYCLKLNRMDGMKWSIAIRYSKVLELRKELIKIFPSLRQINLPAKTYFHWLTFLCSSCSKFDLTRIQQRKKGIVEFLTRSLENLGSVKSEILIQLLAI